MNDQPITIYEAGKHEYTKDNIPKEIIDCCEWIDATTYDDYFNNKRRTIVGLRIDISPH